MRKKLPKPLDFEFIKPETLPTELMPITILTQRISLVHSLLVKGVPKDEIIERILHENYPDIKTKLGAFELIKSVYGDSLFKEHQDTVYTFNLHLARYEDLYSHEMKMENKSGFPLSEEHDLDQISWKLTEALNILKQKEELLGLHDKTLIVEINNIHLKSKQKDNSLFSFESLFAEDRIELLQLIRKLRANANDGVQPFLTIGESEFTAEEASVEEILEEDDGYETPINEVGEVKLLNEDNVTKTLKEVKADIVQSNLEKFKEMMRRARE